MDAFVAFWLGLLVVGGLVVCPIAAVLLLVSLKQRIRRIEELENENSLTLRRLARTLSGDGGDAVSAAQKAAAAPAPAKPDTSPPTLAPMERAPEKPSPVVPSSAPPSSAPPSSVPPSSPPLPPARPVSIRPPIADRQPPPSMPASQPARAPSQPPAAAPTRSAVVQSVQEILRQIVNWLLVGEQHRPRGVSVEYAMATTWLLRLSIAAIVTGVGFFLKWSIDRDLLAPEARAAISIATGALMLAGGLRLAGRKYRLIGHGLMGGGILTLYVSMYATGPYYNLVNIPVAFALMALVTVAAGTIAVFADSLLVAVLGIVGGFATPVLLSTGEARLAVLYSYMLLLSVGILGIASMKPWRLLNYLGFVCTYALYFASLSGYTTEHFAVAIGFLTALFVIHAAIAFVHNVARGHRSTTLEVVHVVANAFLYGWAGYGLIVEAHGRPYPALMALGVAVFYMAQAAALMRSRREDRKLVLTLIALAGAFTAWTLPLTMEKETLTIGLSLLSLTFLWIGARAGSRFLQHLAYGLYAVVMWRLVFMDMPRNFGPFASRASLAPADYWRAMLSRLWTYGTAIGSVAAAYVIQRRGAPGAKTVFDADNDMPVGAPPERVSNVFFWVTALLLFAFVHLEVGTLFLMLQPFRLPVLTVWWCLMGAFFLWRYLEGGQRSQTLFAAAICFMGIALVKLAVIDAAAWKLSERWVYEVPHSLAHVAARSVDFAAVMAVSVVAWAWMSRRRVNPPIAPVFGYGTLAILFAYATLEVNTLLRWRLPAFQSGGLSILWALFAIVFLAVGIGRSVRPLRYIGLVLFAVVVAKVFLGDLRNLDTIYRVIAFVATGVALLLGSVAYVRSNAKFAVDEPRDEARTEPPGEA